MGGFLGTGGMATGEAAAQQAARRPRHRRAQNDHVRRLGRHHVTNPPNANHPRAPTQAALALSRTIAASLAAELSLPRSCLSLLGWLRRDRRKAH